MANVIKQSSVPLERDGAPQVILVNHALQIVKHAQLQQFAHIVILDIS